jgi:protein farnesyltransferase/geranylgeranyltransferase type-1 subunit alpha
MTSESWWFFLSSIPEIFSDVTPVQDVKSYDVASIDYNETFVTVYSYFRAIRQQNEFSERAFQLTGNCLQLNPANYTVWQFRRQCLLQLYPNDPILYVLSELDFARVLGGENPKNYQIWYHRRACLDRLIDTEQQQQQHQQYLDAELDYLGSVLDVDAKNYHAWSNRQWLVAKINQDHVWDKELKYVESLLSDDIHNNSAWNHRWFVTHRGRRKSSPLDLKTTRQELDYALQAIHQDVYNESSWQYYIGILKEQRQAYRNANVPSLLKQARQQIMQLAAFSHHRQSALLDIHEWMEDYETAIAMAQELQTLDPIRQKFWTLKERQLQQQPQLLQHEDK